MIDQICHKIPGYFFVFPYLYAYTRTHVTLWRSIFSDTPTHYGKHTVHTIFELTKAWDIEPFFPQRKIPWFQVRVIEKYYTPGPHLEMILSWQKWANEEIFR